LSHGYWNDRSRTERAFERNPFSENYDERIYRTGDLVKLLPDGNYVFVGRRDDQIKYMGYRIDLGEIEGTLHTLEYINDAAAIAITMTEGENPEIVVFIELDGVGGLDSIREALKARLPAYMQPHKIQVVNKIPRTKNGKVDRQGLKNNYLNAGKHPRKSQHLPKTRQ
ncbi:MAG: hypothetical protein ACFFCW_48540, partial [Candidatus Hodarchaeota archaeon]